MKTARYLPVAAVVVGALFSAPSFADNADIRFRVGDGSFAIAIGTPPPARVVAYGPVVMPGQVWVPGYWAWNGHRQVWTSGVWERPRPHYRQMAGHWEQRNVSRRFEPPRWEARQLIGRHGEQRDYGRQVRYEDRRDQAVFRGRDARREHSR